MIYELPASLQRIREMSNKIPCPAGERFAAKSAPGKTQIYLYEAIGAFEGGISAESVAKSLDAAQAAGSKALEIYLNSPGGQIGEGMAIHSAIRRFNGSRTVFVDGWAASIASVIALAGDRIVTARGATWMIHEPMGAVIAGGNRSDLKAAWEATDAALASLHESMLDVYAKRTKCSRDQLDKWMRAETFMTAAEALERGFTNEIASDGCECDCPECEGGDCAECSCEGCDACAAGKSCDGGECDQGGATAKKKSMPGMPGMRAALPAADLVTLARIKRRELTAKFPGASPGQTGEPVKTSKAAPEKKP